MCKSLLEDDGGVLGFGAGTSGRVLGADATERVLGPLLAACEARGLPKVAEPAVTCLQKLVSNGHLVGDMTSDGLLVETATAARVVAAVVGCGESSDERLQLAVVKALLSFVSSPTFRVHGECLLRAVRVIFNLAIGSPFDTIQTAAAGALQQFLPVVVDRATVARPRLPEGPRAEGDGGASPPGTGKDEGNGGTDGRISQLVGKMPQLQLAAGAEALGPSPSQDAEPLPQDSQREQEIVSESAPGEMQPSSAPQDDPEGQPREGAPPPKGSAAEGTANSSSANMRAAQLASMGEAADLAGLDAALSKKTQGGAPEVGAGGNDRRASDDESKPRADSGAETRAQAVPAVKFGNLPTFDRDAMLVLNAICRLAARQPEVVAANPFLMKGKILATELLLHVLRRDVWEAASEDLIHEMAQPLCLAILRNAASPVARASNLAAELLKIVLLHPKIRASLKPELGAFYPLLVLRPMEADFPELHHVMAALKLLQKACREAQLLVDLFVNFDCDIEQTNNIFERTACALGRLVFQKSRNFNPAENLEVRQLAFQCLADVVESLNSWASVTGLDPLVQNSVPLPASGASKVLASPSPGGAEGTPQVVSEGKRFQEAKVEKEKLSAAIMLFNKSPVKGLKAFEEMGKVPSDAGEKAKFLLDAGYLAKVAIGELFGDPREEYQDVLAEYVNLFDFSSRDFDIALRTFLEGFRLPGEAQQIDRIMEKFAARFCECNPSTFASADQAYLLAFSIIMLNTDLHNPLADAQFSKVDFIAMVNTSTEEEEAKIPSETLELIYDRIAASELKLKESDDAYTANNPDAAANTRNFLPLMGLLNAKKNMERSSAEQKTKMLKQTRQKLLSARSAKQAGVFASWHSSQHGELVQPMLGVMAPPLIEVLQSVFQSPLSEDLSWTAALRMCTQAIALTGLVSLEGVCESLVEVMVEATGFVRIPRLRFTEVHPKRIEALQHLFGVALQRGHLLHGAWTKIFHCICTLESAISSVPTAEPFDLKSSAQMERRESAPATSSFGLSSYQRFFEGIRTSITEGMSPAKDTTQGLRPVSVSQWMAEEGAQLIEQLFSSTQGMDESCIVFFVSALCAASQVELDEPGDEGPSVTLLQKLVETLHHNMGRIRLVWSRMWAVASVTLVSASCLGDVSVSMYAVDSLRQLVVKLLARARTVHFADQGEALRPLVAVMRQCSEHVIRELCVQCTGQIVRTHVEILSPLGWRSILGVCKLSAADGTRAVAAPSLLLLEQALVCIVASQDKSTLLEFVRAVGMFSDNGDLDLAMSALSLLHQAGQASSDLDGELRQAVVSVILEQLSATLASGANKMASLQQHAVEMMFHLLADSAAEFDDAALQEIVESSVKPLFAVPESKDMELASQQFAQWLPHFYGVLSSTVCKSAVFFEAILEVASALFAFVSNFSQLAGLGVQCTLEVARVLSAQPEQTVAEKWVALVAVCESMWEEQTRLIDAIAEDHPSEASDEPVLPLRLPLLLSLACLQDTFAAIYAAHHADMPRQALLQCMDLVSRQVSDVSDRAGRMKSLREREVEGGLLYLRALRSHLSEREAGGSHPAAVDAEEVERRTLGFCAQVMERAVASLGCDGAELLLPLTVEALQACQEVGTAAFKGEVRTIFPPLAKLICHEELAVREAVSGLLSERVASIVS